jgi:hypothetical protein
MARLSNVHNGRYALGHIPAPILDFPKPDPVIFGGRRVRSVSPLEGVPRILAQMPNGSL